MIKGLKNKNILVIYQIVCHAKKFVLVKVEGKQ